MKMAVSNVTVNAMESFLDRYGILKSWIAREVGLSKAVFSQALWSRRFSEEESDRITGFLQTSGRKLERFKFTDNHSEDVQRLRNEFGIKKEWLSRQLGFEHLSKLQQALIRQEGLREEELEILEYAIKDVSRAMKGFAFPDSMRKAA